MSVSTVLITGGSGFLGAHCVIAAVEKGYAVRTTVRSLKRSSDVRQLLLNGGVTEEQADSVEYFAVDLTKDEGWDEACKGCDYLLHVASPYPPTAPENEDDLIIPAREGTLRALRAAKKVGCVKRVVITSSFASIGYGYGNGERTREKPFTESDWTIIDKPRSPVGAYEKSKTLAERAAWQFIEKEGDGLELATVNPVGIFGPVLAKQSSTSLELPMRLLNGQLPGLPHLSFGVVDVRDVADLHLRAMADPTAAGQRYLAISDELAVSTKEIATTLKEGLPAAESKKVPTHSLPNILVRLAGHFDSSVALIVPELGRERPTSNAKAKSELGWKPRGAREAILASAESFKKYELVKF